MKQLTLLIVSFLVLLSPAAAHAFLQDADPRAGDNMKTPPRKIILHFTEDLEQAFSAIAVSDEDGHDMTAGASATSGAEMDVPLVVLKPGRYRVHWHAVSVDTHRTEGKYNFVVLP